MYRLYPALAFRVSDDGVYQATGKKPPWVNKNYVRSIVGFKKEESEAILNMLYTLIATSQDFQLRVHWEPGIVIACLRQPQHAALRRRGFYA